MGEINLENKKDIKTKSKFAKLWRGKEWWTVWLGIALIVAAVGSIIEKPVLPKEWGVEGAESIWAAIPAEIVTGMLTTGLITLIIFAVAVFFSKREEFTDFLKGYPVIFLLSILAYVLGNYAPLRHYGFNDVIWALVIGLIISNLTKVPQFLQGAVRTGLYIKTGLVLLGASILFDRMLALGAMGLGVAWLVTPAVLIVMYWYSQKVLKMHDNKGLAITIATATSVCGVSAAIASGTASKAKQEEITLAVSITLIFTVLMMVGMPAVVQLLGIDPIVGGAWLGGTIDATGAVVASSALLGAEAMEVASIIKMVQNILIGIIAFGIAIFWVTKYENKSATEVEISFKEIFTRIPKFIFGFIGASLVFSFLLTEATVEASLPVLNGFRGFFFTLAFISIGLDSNFKDMAQMVKGGKAIQLYIGGQLLNIVLTLLASYIFFSGQFFNLPF
ncbi:putative sulfate exporter family transporter [Natroniella sulfidigena]|uniref:YeiH family protein n=1 Tax=Natroniella sulfidigena TaxID=723921 RepID=UPI00200B3C8D|nr:putative sulfate exporter family transporter [Natroniella sulfidigena]MCK8816119.1 putative sulfate exporter family transporter [Natroniella sulfidigena]